MLVVWNFTLPWGLTVVKQRAIIGQYDMMRGVRFFFKDALVKYLVFAAIVFVLAQVVLLAFYIRPTSTPISLHYTTYLGVDFIGAWYLVYLFPTVSLLFSLANLGLAYGFMRKDKLLSYLLLIGATFCAALFFVQSILIVRLNS